MKLPKEIKIFENVPGKKSKFFSEIAWRYRNVSEICLEKSSFFTRMHDPPQISNQIDAADACSAVDMVDHEIPLRRHGVSFGLIIAFNFFLVLLV